MVSQNYTGVNFLSRRNIENWHETHQPSDVTLETFNVINVFVSRPFIWEWFEQTDEQLKPLQIDKCYHRQLQNLQWINQLVLGWPN